eukprot:COSAG01_NODE_73749_length_237_cov_13.652174_1_plen_43_part_01
MYIVVNVLGIPSQCNFSPKMSDSGGLQDAMQYCIGAGRRPPVL